MFGIRRNCPYVLKETCQLIHSTLDKRLTHQDWLLYFLVTLGIGTVGTLVTVILMLAGRR